MSQLSRESILAAPKVVLHDHLDGGLRAGTLIELAAEIGHELPAREPEELARWMEQQADSGSLVEFLKPFVHTTAVLQSASALTRVAHEFVLDMASDGVVYAETRLAPEQSTAGDLQLHEVVEAVLAGLRSGEAAVAATGHTIKTGFILCAMRQANRALEVARTALEFRDQGVGWIRHRRP